MDFKTSALIYAEIQNSNLSDDTKKWIFDRVMEDICPTEESKKPVRNTSGIYQIDAETRAVIGSYTTQKEASLAIGKKENSTGIGDALNRRVKSHYAYGYLWCYKNVWDAMEAEERNAYV